MTLLFLLLSILLLGAGQVEASSHPTYTVRLYLSTAGILPGNWANSVPGGFNGKDLLCGIGNGQPATCFTAWALVSAPGSGYCLLTNAGGSYSPAFNNLSPVYGTGIYTGNTIGSWAGLWGPNINFATVGISGNSVWMGVNGFTCPYPAPSGPPVPAPNLQCVSGSSWMSTSSSDHGEAGSLVSTAGNWWDAFALACDQFAYILCGCLEVITSSPTVPTNSPTVPTNSPTVPTASPVTKSPTTKSPTQLPSRAPSATPTRRPTFGPSRAPSTSPTRRPTKFPTAKPSRAPSFRQPSMSPTPPTSAPTAPTIAFHSKCGYGECQSQNSSLCVRGDEPQCACIPSQQGSLCREATFQGDIEPDGQINCAGMFQDPEDVAAPCTPIVQTSSMRQVLRRKAYSTCRCFDSRTKGSFRSSAPPGKMGQPSPPVCDLCKSDGIGPPVGTVVDVFSLRAPITCTQYGGPDPSLSLNSTLEYEVEERKWVSCSGHGDWDLLRYRCNCYSPAWQLQQIPSQVGITNETAVVTCSRCSELWGPPGLCSFPWTPDPVNGRFAACGGHGAYTPTGCACYTNSTAGYWQLAAFERPTTLLVYSDPIGARVVPTTAVASVQSCVACQSGYGRAEDGCLKPTPPPGR